MGVVVVKGVVVVTNVVVLGIGVVNDLLNTEDKNNIIWQKLEQMQASRCNSIETYQKF